MPRDLSTARRVVFEDPDLPHQIVITAKRGGHELMVSCNCLRTSAGGHQPIETRNRWESGEAIAAWRAHMEGTSNAA